MEKTDYIERLSAIKARYGRWNDSDRGELKSMVAELGIKHSFRGRCNNCYNDAFHLVMHHLGLKSADLVVPKETPSGKYTFVGVGRTEWHGINGTFVLDENTPDATVERFIKNFPKQKIYKLNKNTDMDITFISKPNAVHTVVADAGVQPVPAGLTSLQGVQGVQGEQGVQGVQGEQGVQGVQGEQGVQGVQGEQGVQGVQGEQGVQGVQGEQGVQSEQGN